MRRCAGTSVRSSTGRSARWSALRPGSWPVFVAVLLVDAGAGGGRVLRVLAVAVLAVPVRVGLGGLLVLAVAAPYWWFSHGALADACMDLMPLWALGTLGIWAAWEWMAGAGRRRVVGVVATG